jgi:hypothetical protein
MTIKFSNAQNKGCPHNPKTRRWDILLSHNNEKVGEINKDFSDRECRHPKYTLDLMGQLVLEGWYLQCGLKTEKSYSSLFDAKDVARAILQDKELLISILTRQRENQIARSVNQAWSAT